MLSKKDYLDQLYSLGYTYEFIFNDITDEHLKQIIPTLTLDKAFSRKDCQFITYDLVKSTCAISKNSKNEIIAIGGLKKIFNNYINNFVYDVWYYRIKEKPLPLIGHNVLMNLTYWYSFEYIQKNNISDVKAFQILSYNTKLLKTVLSNKNKKRKLFFNDLEYLGKDHKNDNLYGRYY